MPEDSRAAEGAFLKQDFLTEENLASVRALNEIAEAARPDARADGDRLGAARRARHLGADRRPTVEQLEDSLGALDNLDFTADELAEIDQHAVEAGINLWAESSEN